MIFIDPKPIKNTHNLYYVKSHHQQKRNEEKGRYAPSMENVHFLHSKEKRFHLDLLRWVFSVAGLPADSPRFAYYVSRWDIPAKIAAAKKAGTFNDTTRKCPHIDPAWLRFVPAALAEHAAFWASIKTPPNQARQSSGIEPAQRKTSARAA